MGGQQRKNWGWQILCISCKPIARNFYFGVLLEDLFGKIVDLFYKTVDLLNEIKNIFSKIMAF